MTRIAYIPFNSDIKGMVLKEQTEKLPWERDLQTLQ